MAKKFPDLSGDGKITKKDILMGRGVVKKQAGGQINGLKKITYLTSIEEPEHMEELSLLNPRWS